MPSTHFLLTPSDRTAPPRAAWRTAVLGLLLVVSIAVAIPVSIVARDTDHPVSAAVVFVIVILVNGALGGLATGLLAAIASSIIYGFFLRFPVYRFGLASIDDFIPLVAFSLTAIISGVLSGRLADRAHVAENAQHQLEKLLALSSDLQRAITLEDIADALSRATVDRDVATQIFHAHGHARPGDDTAFPPSLPPPGAAAGASLPRDAVLSLLGLAMDRHDLIERKTSAEAALKAEQFKTALLSCVSHDLLTPLAIISASASGLNRFGARLTPAVRDEMLVTIEEQSERLKDFVERMLQLSRLDAGLSRQDLQPVEVDEVLRDAVRHIRQLHPARAIDFGSKDVPLVSLGLSDLLMRVFVNLLENAVHYGTDPIAAAVARDADGGGVRVTVTNAGAPIAMDDLPHMFERFYRGANAARRDGMGLGLAFSRDFVTFLGGSVVVESPIADGRGTRVTVWLPAVTGQDVEMDDAGENPAGGRRTGDDANPHADPADRRL